MAEEAFHGWCAGGDDANRGLDDRYHNTNIPSSIGICRREPVVVDNETDNGDGSGDPTHTHDDYHCDLSLPPHLQIPHHRGRNGYYNEIHEDAKATAGEDECKTVDAFAVLDDVSVGVFLLVHFRSQVCVADRRTLKDVHECSRDHVANVNPN